MTPFPPLASLNGGLTTRLRPRTLRVPKAMTEVADAPFIAHQLRLLRLRVWPMSCSVSLPIGAGILRPRACLDRAGRWC